MELSIVTTLYYSAPYLPDFYRRISAAAAQITDAYEIILVNDGSPDNTLEIAVSLHEADRRVKVIDLSRNFGHHKAMMTGLMHARGRLVFLIDCDLEEEPELLTLFHGVYEKNDADVVYGVQAKRKGALFERVSGALFYLLVNLLSDYRVPANALVARLMSKRYVAALVEHLDRELFILGLWTITGFKQVPVSVRKNSKGRTAYTFLRKIGIFVNAVTSFSIRPLVAIFYLGLAIMLLSGLAALWLISRTLLYGTYLAGWPSLIVSVWMLGGMTIFCLGIIGIYVAKIFSETKRRPYTVVRRVYGGDGAELDHARS